MSMRCYSALQHKLGWRLFGLAGCLYLLGGFIARGDVKLHALFSDHMVLQQGLPAPVWGWADDGEVVRVQFCGQEQTATATGGKWKVRLQPLKAGGPFTMTVTGKNKVELNDVLVGEVWVCSGQSNMEWPLRSSFDPQTDIANSAAPSLRLFTAPKLRAKSPVDNLQAAWVECGPQTVPGFSAVAYYFGRALLKSRDVPVGLIHTSWGGSPAEVWMSEAVLTADPEWKRDIWDPYPAALAAHKQRVAQWEKEKQEAESQGKKFDRGRPWDPWCPAELYNGMIAPLIPYAIRGAIWYQGESNASRALQYRRLFQDMISNWRRDWGQGNFTFLAVQLAPWDRGQKRTLEQITATPVESDWAELREAQMLATKQLPKVGAAVITDMGDKDDIHPAKKGPVGERLALAARAIAYGEKITAFGPVYRSVKFSGAKATLSFEHVGRGLEAKGGALTGFAIAGEDRKFVWAQAEIRGKNVIVSNPAVSKPVAVRYGWADYPVVNLWNRDGLPASPFRTDDFPMVSAPKK